MDDPQNTPVPDPLEPSVDPRAMQELESFAAQPAIEAAPAMVPQLQPAEDRRTAVTAFYVNDASERRRFRHNLYWLLSLSLAAFVLASWIMVRVDSPFGMFSTGPQEIVRAQLRALDRGDLRPAYDMFSERYRGQVSFDTWHELFVRHWRMFHADVVHTESPAYSGPGVTLEIYLHGADERDYRARFTLIRTDGRWWIDDVHWTQEPDPGEVSRT